MERKLGIVSLKDCGLSNSEMKLTLLIYNFKTKVCSLKNSNEAQGKGAQGSSGAPLPHPSYKKNPTPKTRYHKFSENFLESHRKIL